MKSVIIKSAIWALYSGLLILLAYTLSDSLSKDSLISMWLFNCFFSASVITAAHGERKSSGGSLGAGGG